MKKIEAYDGEFGSKKPNTYEPRVGEVKTFTEQELVAFLKEAFENAAKESTI